MAAYVIVYYPIIWQSEVVVEKDTEVVDLQIEFEKTRASTEWTYRRLGFASFAVMFLSIVIAAAGAPACGLLVTPALIVMIYSIRRIGQLERQKQKPSKK